MTSSNRTMNRILLFVLGLVAIVVAVVAGAGVLPPVRDAIAPYVTLPDRVTIDTGTLWIIVAVSAVVIVLSLTWILTRGRGGTSIALREGSDDDQVTINVGLVRDVVEHELADVRDVVGTRVDLYRVRRSRAARVRVAVRRGGDAGVVLDAVDRAIATLDRILGREIPTLVHLTGGTRAALTRRTRVQ
ncbi:hypothetical protein [Curtobacterium sp. RRHDQ10]|uniref:hypothetical protein n=1 Tax=Curtobacterium phyllosphaerae TaxID=3413379 RepID=UPI003BF0D171